jgi:hypothetical protein
MRGIGRTIAVAVLWLTDASGGDVLSVRIRGAEFAFVKVESGTFTMESD